MEILNWLEAANPIQTAFSDENGSITYGDFIARAKAVGSALIEAIPVRRRPIAVLFERSISSLVAFFGIIYSGNFYVPIDSSQPFDRVTTILSQLLPAAILRVGDPAPWEALVQKDYKLIPFDQLCEHAIDHAQLAAVKDTALDIDPLYAICTSGSTGIPKAVLISHRSVVDFINVFVDTFGFDENEVFGNQAPFDFDVSVKDIYSTIYCHARMHIIPKICFSMPKQLIDTLNAQRITTVIWAVSAVCIPSSFNTFSKYAVPLYLKNVLFSGETMPMKQLNIWRKAMPEVRYVNLYGPTEITCNCMYYIVDRAFSDTDTLPLGRSFPNEQVFVLNDDGKPIGSGETGEICVRGTCLALGYYNDEARTRQAFRQNPAHNLFPDPLYFTGDLASMNDQSEYVFASRRDFQIKHMGHRIELGEIETFAAAIDGIRRVCCIFNEIAGKIVLFYEGEVEKTAIIAALKNKLPKYMLPNIYTQLEHMPYNKNGKIDRARLRSMA